MKEIGEILRKAREEKGLNLEEVHEKTHITVHYLKAIEAGDMSVFSAEVYYTGTLRRYADFLGLKGSELVNRYHAALAEQRAIVEEQNKPKKEQAITRSRELLWAGIGIVVVIAAVWLVIALRGRHAIGPAEQPTAVSTAPAAGVAAPVSTAPAAAPAPSTAPAVQAPPATTTAPAAVPAARRMNLEITASQDTWVKITADGAIAFEGPVMAGVTRTWGADRRFQLVIGYVPGVTVKLNGKPVDITSGARNDVNELILTTEALR